MALTNIGACHLILGQLNESEIASTEAIRRDPLAPLPHFNLAMLHHAKNQPEDRDAYFRRAQQLGYRGSLSDALAMHAMNAYATVEGRQAKPDTLD